MEIAIVVVAGILLLVLFAGKYFQRGENTGRFEPAVSLEENYHSEPIISYSLLLADVKTNRLMEISAPADYEHHYGILNGQHIEIHWNVLNADFISIEGVGYVNAVGKKSFFPQQHTVYKISARNRNYSSTREIVVHVFPVPLIETVFSPIPDLSYSKIEIDITPLPPVSKPDPKQFPGLQIPSPVEIQKNLATGKPLGISLNKALITPATDKAQYRSFKTKLFDVMEKQARGNYKLTDIIQTIRKHYE